MREGSADSLRNDVLYSEGASAGRLANQACDTGDLDEAGSRDTDGGLLGAEDQFRVLLDALPNLVVVHQDNKIVFFNQETLRASGRTAEEMYNLPMITDVALPDRPAVLENSRRRLAGEKVDEYEIVVRRQSGEPRNAIVRSTLIIYRGRPATLTMLIDITEKKHAEEERERLIAELREALSKIKTLSGMLPICASCKKIRDDKGYWEQIEVYIRDHSNADFSHGLCPQCAATLYPQYFKEP